MPSLIEPVTLRGLTLRNRIVISPMCQYSAEDGIAGDWHLVQYGRFAVGGAGLVFVEATAVSPEGRITHGDTGIWSDAHAAALARIATFVTSQGAVPGIQLGHAGRKASMQRPWFGNGPLGPEDAARGDLPWPILAPSALPIGAGYLLPEALDEAGIRRIIAAFLAAAERARGAGFEVVELHGAHGYLLHQFLSPLTNRRTDAWGGDAAGRMRLPLEIARGVRALWPQDRPVFMRISCVDGVQGGLTLEDQIGFARALREAGVDVVDCSSGGIGGPATAAKGPPRGYGHQVPYAARIRAEAGIATMAVGLIVDPRQAQAVLDAGAADLVAIGRQALEEPNWPLAAVAALASPAARHAASPHQHGWWLANRQAALERIGPWRGDVA
ncbi:MAG TPA: NADH:flavin oxidoreductase/NADH oxidase [Crenalkalicoccus sp.]|nr:NADH:flavin oxidoreductase/NADH oxidase [Crenalkalicoccus sp.]